VRYMLFESLTRKCSNFNNIILRFKGLLYSPNSNALGII
jgi:hypothetical protein